MLDRGDFLAVAEGRVLRFQAAHVSPKEIREVVAYLAQGGGAPWQVGPSRSVNRLAKVFRGGA
ncbi:MAG: hypothetical protein V3S14_05790 [Anaerolineae bacterium]